MKIERLKAGDLISYSGEMIVMRDAAQKRLMGMYLKGLKLPVSLSNGIVFYAGPAKAPKGRNVGAIGPTTSVRMDGYLEMLYELGVIATVGKGKRTNEAAELCKRYGKIYFVTPSGCAAAMSRRIDEMEILAFEDLGTEAIYRIECHDFPLLVAIDSSGVDIFERDARGRFNRIQERR